MRAKIAVIVSLVLIVPVIAGAQSDESADAETTFDGLVEVRRARFRNVWVKPGVDVSRYSKILPGPAQFHYRDVPPVSRTTARRSSQQDFPIEENSRARLEELTPEIFREEVAKSEHFTIVDEAGRDTLFIYGALYDIVSHVPPDYVGRSDIYISSVGQATLVIQIEDSMSREVLGRIVERRAAEPAFGAQISSTVTNLAEVRRLIRRWGTVFRNGLDRWYESGGQVE